MLSAKGMKEDYETYTCLGHHLAFHGDPLRDPIKLPIGEGMIEHGPIFFVYPKDYFPPYLGLWEFNKPLN